MVEADNPGEGVSEDETPAVDIDVTVVEPVAPEPEPVPEPEPIIIEQTDAAPNIDSEVVSQLIAIREALTLQGVAIAELQSRLVATDADSAIARDMAASANQQIAEIADEVEEIREGEQAKPEDDVKPERKDWQSKFLGS